MALGDDLLMGISEVMPIAEIVVGDRAVAIGGSEASVAEP